MLVLPILTDFRLLCKKLGCSRYFHFNGCKYVTPEYYASIKAHRIPTKGDILYSAVGATLGIPAIVNTDEEFCFQRYVALIKPNPNKLLSKFLWYMLKSGTLYKKAWEGTTGSAQPTVPLRAIRMLPIPVPPLPEQHRIVAYLDELQTKVDKMKRLREQAMKELDALLPSILDKAFKGEL
ncbi:MAG: restriction endonuclease subunit S [Nostoc sp.]|uniref:restriction endonuclease subunit S n=1 Tax=Nostoc sp. TaxID=1180 RepID=UPI002FEEECEB